MLIIWSYSVFRDNKVFQNFDQSLSKFKNCPLKNHFIWVWVRTHTYIISPSVRTTLFKRLDLDINMTTGSSKQKQAQLVSLWIMLHYQVQLITKSGIPCHLILRTICTTKKCLCHKFTISLVIFDITTLFFWIYITQKNKNKKKPFYTKLYNFHHNKKGTDTILYLTIYKRGLADTVSVMDTI